MPRTIDTDKCLNCGACEGQCPVSAISEGDGARIVDDGVCVDCGACESVCPADAIHQK